MSNEDTYPKTIEFSNGPSIETHSQEEHDGLMGAIRRNTRNFEARQAAEGKHAGEPRDVLAEQIQEAYREAARRRGDSFVPPSWRDLPWPQSAMVLRVADVLIERGHVPASSAPAGGEQS